jgi:hypothetical protein
MSYFQNQLFVVLNLVSGISRLQATPVRWTCGDRKYSAHSTLCYALESGGTRAKFRFELCFSLSQESSSQSWGYNSANAQPLQKLCCFLRFGALRSCFFATNGWSMPLLRFQSSCSLNQVKQLSILLGIRKEECNLSRRCCFYLSPRFWRSCSNRGLLKFNEYLKLRFDLNLAPKLKFLHLCVLKDCTNYLLSQSFGLNLPSPDILL